jgi:hypothetical protein
MAPTAMDAKPGIVLAACSDQGAWLLSGEEHINALLEGRGYPVPGMRLRFDDADALADYLEPGGLDVSGLWTIHGNILARLQQAGELRDVTPPQAKD